MSNNTDIKEVKVQVVDNLLNVTEKLYEDLKRIVGDENLSHSNVISILLSLMQVVEHYVISGVQKKTLVLRALDRLIEDQFDDKQEADKMKLLVQLTLPTVIDTIVSIDKKSLQINVKKGFRKLFVCCR
jgi:hypothetical protein